MSAAGWVSAGGQLVGGVALAPLLPGLTQHWKARLQGRRGPSPLQPYRELRRLWRKSVVDVEGTTAIYRLAPNVLLGLETTQIRTNYLGQGIRINNHYDLALAYHF